MIAPTDEAPTLTSRLPRSIVARVLPGEPFNRSRTRAPFCFSNNNVFRRNRDIENIAASIPEKKALQHKKKMMMTRLGATLFISDVFNALLVHPHSFPLIAVIVPYEVEEPVKDIIEKVI